MLGDLHRLVTPQVPALHLGDDEDDEDVDDVDDLDGDDDDLFVAGGHEDLGAVVVPADVEHWPAHGLLRLRHRLPRVVYLPAPGARHV